jgi:hypothetical protein
MRRRERLALALLVALSLAAAVLAGRVLRRLEQGGAGRVELARLRPTALSPRTLYAFERLPERLLATYYVSDASRMPSEMRRMPLEVADLLGALRARFPERFDFQLVDPEEGEGLAGFAARRRIAPFRLRSVTRDAWAERTVWSTLVLSGGSAPEARIAGLRPAHLPHLQELLAAWLEERRHPRAPRLALAAPEGFDELADALAERGPLARVDLDGGAEVPEVDCLLWMRPARVTGTQLVALERLLARGAGVIVAGSSLEPHEEVRAGVPWVSFAPRENAMEQLGAHFGLALEPALVLDRSAEELDFEGGRVQAPHWIRSIAPDQDFHRFASQPNGTLLFRAPSPFTPLPARLAEERREASVLATSSDGTWLVPSPPREPVPLASLGFDAPRDGPHATAKQALAVEVAGDDPWAGEIVFLAAETPLADGFLHREHVAHAHLLDVLLARATSPERLVRTSVDLDPAPPLPAFGPAARLGWRLFGIALPVLGLALLVHGRGLARAGGALGRTIARGAHRALAPAAVLAALLALLRLARALPLELDATEGGLNRLAPAARAIAARAGERGPIEATLVLSASERLPPALRAPARALAPALAAFRRAGAGIALRAVAPEDLGAAERGALDARGIAPASGVTDDDGVTRVARFTCALALARGGREVVLDFPDARAFERLEFRLALALERLGGRAVPRVAFASDVPRLSAAEAFEQYQEKGLFAPRGTDVFALARASLARNDLEVVHVNPRAPELPADVGVLVWLQPRRSIEPMLAATVRWLHGGGKVVLAAQHFKLRAQQFRGGDFEPRFWPQPQSPDLELLYFPELSIELVREVLFDELCLPIAAESQLTGRSGARDFERQASALPFQIRLSAAGYAPHALTRGLGDQAFLYANRLRWDEARLAALGLRATPLAVTSARTWSYAWKGGWVPSELLAGPAELEGSSGAETLGPQPLWVLFEGTFPKPAGPLALGGAVPDPGTPAEEPPWPAPAPGALAWIGDSSFLENERLIEDADGPAFRGDALLWNAVAGLAFEGELAELATRARPARGFGHVAPRARLLWRAGVTAGGPALLALVAAGIALLRRRAGGGARA